MVLLVSVLETRSVPWVWLCDAVDRALVISSEVLGSSPTEVDHYGYKSVL